MSFNVLIVDRPEDHYCSYGQGIVLSDILKVSFLPDVGDFVEYNLLFCGDEDRTVSGKVIRKTFLQDYIRIFVGIDADYDDDIW